MVGCEPCVVEKERLARLRRVLQDGERQVRSCRRCVEDTNLEGGVRRGRLRADVPSAGAVHEEQSSIGTRMLDDDSHQRFEEVLGDELGRDRAGGLDDG